MRTTKSNNIHHSFIHSFMNNDDNDCDIHAVPFRRALVVDAGFLAHKRHVIHGLIEVDVTHARRKIHETSRDAAATSTSKQQSPPVSFTAFVVASYAQAIAADPTVQALPDWSGRHVVVFHNVDVVTMIEPSVGAVAIPHIIRNANLKSVNDITQEIRTVQAHPNTSHQQGGVIDVAARLPRWLRMLTYRWFRFNPYRFREMQGTAMLTSVGMFGRSTGGYGIGFLTVHTVGLTVGGISHRPGFDANGHVVPRDYLHLTLSFDHDIVDGAPAARFANRLVELLESASVLVNAIETPQVFNDPLHLE